jgi:hypothetical protein
MTPDDRGWPTISTSDATTVTRLGASNPSMPKRERDFAALGAVKGTP